MKKAIIRKCAALRIVSLACFPLSLAPGGSEASIIFDWTGTCTAGCTGTATAVLTLSDSYTFGAALYASGGTNFIEQFVYHSTSRDFTLNNFDPVAGGINADGSIAIATVNIRLNPAGADAFPVFLQYTPTYSGIFQAANSVSSFDQGSAGSFTLRQAVPEPATLALFGLGLAGLGAVRRKKLAA